MDHIQFFLVPALLVLFFVWRIYQFKRVKAMVPELIASGAIVVDVRTPQEFETGAREGSLNFPLTDLVARAKELDQNKTIILCCASGTRSAIATGILKKLGFKNVLNAGPWMNTLT